VLGSGNGNRRINYNNSNTNSMITEGDDIDKDKEQEDKKLRYQILKKYIVDNFKIVLQHKEGIIAYDILLGKDAEMSKYKYMHNYNFVFRAQPYPPHYQTDIDQSTSDYKKVFFAFNTRDGKSACDPMILYVNKNIKVHELKRLLVEKLLKVNKVRENNISMSSLKFYTFKFQNNLIEKERLLIDSRDEVEVTSYFKQSVWNLLAEFPAKSSDFQEEGSMIIK